MKHHARGSVMLLFVGIVLVLVGVAVLGFDLGHAYIARNQLQNAADSSAMAGALCLDRQASGSADCSSNYATTGINWTSASGKATAQLANNSVDNVPLSTTDSGHQINVGYWNLLQHAPSGGSWSTTLATPTANDKPAVQVIVTKDNGENNGRVGMMTARMFGGSNMKVSAQAVALISSPGAVPAGDLIPQAIDQCMHSLYWNSATNTPYTATSTSLNGVAQQIGQPWEFQVGSSIHYGTCEAGQWTSFAVNNNSQSYVKGLIQNGNPAPLSIGDSTYIQPGTKGASYGDLSTQYPIPNPATPAPCTGYVGGATVAGWLVAMPVVNETALVSGATPIVAFASFCLDAVVGGSGKYIQGHFAPGLTVSGSSGIGPSYGAYTPPVLGQ